MARPRRCVESTIRKDGLSVMEEQPARLSGSLPPKLQDRIAREKAYYEEYGAGGYKRRDWVRRMSAGFYDKGFDGRLWGEFWRTVDLRGALVLDYGCGDGAFSQRLVRRGARVCGLDISEEIVAQARAANPPGDDGFPQFFVGDAHRTPFSEGTFDYVTGNGALHHLDLDRAYEEVHRVLKPGGRAFFLEPMYYHPLLWLWRRMTPKLHTEDERPLSAADWERARGWFRKVSHCEHFLLAVCAAPVHLLGRGVALSVISGVDRVDQVLMRVAPPLRRLAWLAVLEMEK
jgi:SAM-dependent methyltransferase